MSPATRARILGALVACVLGSSATTEAGTAAAGTAAAESHQGSADTPAVVPDEAIVRYRGDDRERVLSIDPAVGIEAELDRLEADPRVRWAIPNAIAQIAVNPNDPGRHGEPGGWRQDQWNFLDPPGEGQPCSTEAPCGVGAPRAWALLENAGNPLGRRDDGRRGPIVAVVDTGVAYRRKGSKFRPSPDFSRAQFVGGRDFVDGDRVPLDRNGHGTHVASTIAERHDNGVAVTGLAPGVRVMPIRVLTGAGSGSASDVAKGIRWAARHGAKVINLSLEFPRSFSSCKRLRSVCRAIRMAERGGSIVIGAAGNLGTDRALMPGKVTFSTAATTIRGCLSEFSNYGAGVDIAAPGGGGDDREGGSHCQPGARGPGIVQLTLSVGPSLSGDFTRFGYPRYEGTSMAAAHTSSAAALVLASRVLHRGRKAPTPAQVQAHLECTARAAADPVTADRYGAGLLDLTAALEDRNCTN